LEGVCYVAVAHADPGYDAEETHETDDTGAVGGACQFGRTVRLKRTRSANTYIEPSVKTTLRMIFCLSSRVNLHTIGIGRANIIRSAIRAYMISLC
jgi:hypothetical protein